VKKGDVVLLPFPFTDVSGNKVRPAVVLVVDELDVTVAFLTTQSDWQRADDLLLTPSETNGLKKQSLLRVPKLATIERSLVLGRLGSLSEPNLSALNQKLILVFQLSSQPS
jgi:mRNA interferase MazF